MLLDSRYYYHVIHGLVGELQGTLKSSNIFQRRHYSYLTYIHFADQPQSTLRFIHKMFIWDFLGK